jgi:PAS domain S-box-containing protein
MVLTDPRVEDNPIVYVNSAFERSTGYSRSAVIGRNCRFLQGEETDKAHVDALRGAIENKEDVTVDILNYRANGEPFTNRLIIAPINDADGHVIYFLGIQKELRESERDKADIGFLLRDVSARVTDDLSMVLEGIEHPDLREPFAYESMHRRLEALQLTYESMVLSDRQDEDDPSHAGGIDLGSLLSRVAAAVAHEEGRPGIRYVQQIEALEVNLSAAVRLALLVSEVLSNAFSHAFERMEEGFIELRMARLAAGGLRLVITDDGIGLRANAPYPDPETIGGRLMQTLTTGLDATLTPVRGAAGTVVMIDVPAGVTEL